MGLRLAPSADNTILEIRGPCRIILQFSAMVHCKTAKKNNKKNNKDTKIKTNRNKSKKKTVVHDNIGRVGHCRAVTVAQFPRQDSATGKPGKPGKLAPGK